MCLMEILIKIIKYVYFMCGIDQILMKDGIGVLIYMILYLKIKEIEVDLYEWFEKLL